jgi:hypothetical protein
MTDDFQLFASNHEDPAFDADIALIAAYLARELSLVQIVAVRERLATDRSFRAKAEPLIHAFALPGQWDNGLVVAGRALGGITREELDAGWQRHLATQTRQPRASGAGALPSHRAWTMKRIAAVVAVIVLPMMAVAQVVHYVVTHRGEPEVAGVAPQAAVNDVRPESPLGSVVERAAVVSPTAEQSAAARPLGAVVARSTELTDVTQLVPLGDGRVLAHDPLRQQVLVLDAALKIIRAVVDSTPGDTTSYSWGGPTIVMAAGAKSARIYQPAQNVFLLIDSTGRYTGVAPYTTRPLRPPPPQRGLPGSSPQRGPPAPTPQRGPPAPSTGGSAVPGPAWLSPVGYSHVFGVLARTAAGGPTRRMVPLALVTLGGSAGERATWADSIAVVGVNVAAGRVDTLGSIANGRTLAAAVQRGGRGATDSLISTTSTASLIPFVDQIVVAADGAVGFFRSRDARFEWLNPDGRRTMSAAIPSPSLMLTAADLRTIADSIDLARIATRRSALEAWVRDSIALATAMGAATTNRGGGLVPARPIPRIRPDTTNLPRVDVRELGDRLPATDGEAIIADAENRVWVVMRTRPRPPAGAGLIYHVVDRAGRVVDRVQIPPNTRIVGFSPGHVYLRATGTAPGPLLKARFR